MSKCICSKLEGESRVLTCSNGFLVCATSWGKQVGLAKEADVCLGIDGECQFQSGRVSQGYSQLLVHENHGASKLGLQCHVYTGV